MLRVVIVLSNWCLDTETLDPGFTASSGSFANSSLCFWNKKKRKRRRNHLIDIINIKRVNNFFLFEWREPKQKFTLTVLRSSSSFLELEQALLKYSAIAILWRTCSINWNNSKDMTWRLCLISYKDHFYFAIESVNYLRRNIEKWYLNWMMDPKDLRNSLLQFSFSFPLNKTLYHLNTQKMSSK